MIHHVSSRHGQAGRLQRGDSPSPPQTGVVCGCSSEDLKCLRALPAVPAGLPQLLRNTEADRVCKRTREPPEALGRRALGRLEQSCFPVLRSANDTGAGLGRQRNNSGGGGLASGLDPRGPPDKARIPGRVRRRQQPPPPECTTVSR
ncbi:unnamed protein product [Boreogadus saida]